LPQSIPIITNCTVGGMVSVCTANLNAEDIVRFQCKDGVNSTQFFAKLNITRLTGVRGYQGEQGPQGNVGPQGNTGAQGVDGPTGADSQVQGPQGFDGSQGNTGATGATGADSQVQGPQGAVGAQGNTGSQGAVGAQGVRGFQGPAVSFTTTQMDPIIQEEATLTYDSEEQSMLNSLKDQVNKMRTIMINNGLGTA